MKNDITTLNVTDGNIDQSAANKDTWWNHRHIPRRDGILCLCVVGESIDERMKMETKSRFTQHDIVWVVEGSF